MLTNACHTLHRFTAGLSATSSRRCSRTGITQLVVELRAASIVITLHASRHRKSQDRHTRRSVNGTNAFCLAVAHGQPARGSAHVGFWRLLTDHCAARGVAVPIKFRCETRARRSLVTAHYLAMHLTQVLGVQECVMGVFHGGRAGGKTSAIFHPEHNTVLAYFSERLRIFTRYSPQTPSPSGHPLLSGPPPLNHIHQIYHPTRRAALAGAARR